MKDTITLKEIEAFLDEKLNYKSKGIDDKKWGTSTHQIRPHENQGSYTIYIVDNLTPNFDVGGLRIDKEGFIYYLDIDSYFLASENGNGTKDLYIGTDMRKELKERFVGKKLLG